MTRARELADLAGLVAADSASIAWDTNTLYIDATNNRIGVTTSSPSVSLDMGSATDAVHIPSGTTQQRPSGSNGMFRYNTTDAQFEGYADGSWGAIAGGGGGSALETNHFTGDGSTTAFTLGTSVSSEDDLLVFIEGIYQNKADYVASGTTLTLDVAPLSGRKIVAHHVKSGISGSNLVQNSFSGNGSTTDFTLSLNPVSENNTQVFIDGLYQQKDAYSTSGTTLSFSEAPPNNSTIEVMLFTQTDINTATIVQDADKDTKIQVEESSDEDKIRFDTAGVERMIIDSTGVLIGTTDTSPYDNSAETSADNGVVISDGRIWAARLGGSPIDINRTQSDGDLQVFRINGSVVGSIASVATGKIGFYGSGGTGAVIDSSGNFGIGGTSGGERLLLEGSATAGARIKFSQTTASLTSQIQQGSTGMAISTAGSNPILLETNGVTRWSIDSTNGHLRANTNGIGINFDASEGSNATSTVLDDYEEGTWTPVCRDNSPSGTVITSTTVKATYTKIGRLVYVHAYVSRNTATSYTGVLVITGLPYSVASTTTPMNGNVWIDNASTDYTAICYGTGTSIYLKEQTGNDYITVDQWENNRPFYLGFTYEVYQ